MEKKEDNVSKETKTILQKVNPYNKVREEDDPETEAFAKGELTKFHREQRQKEAEAATEQKDPNASEETAEPTDKKATPIAERPVNAEDRAFKKRYDDLKKHYDSTINKHKEELSSLRGQLESNSKQFTPPKSKEELEAWKKEYPDVYDMVETIAMNKATTQSAELESKFKNLQVQQEQIAKEKAQVELIKLHPDFDDIRAKDDFHQWAEEQDPTIQGWLYENTSNAKLAARAIDLYKMDRGLSKLNKVEEKDVKKEAAKAISKTKKATDSDIPKKKIWTTSEISKLKPHQFEKFEKEIDLARLEGRIEQR
jgi:archaellum component FlaC